MSGSHCAQHGAAVSIEIHHAIEQFLRREARLLDEERLEEWLDLLTPDIHYWMPGIQARYRKDQGKLPANEGMAYFDDDLDYLRKRVARMRDSGARGEDPPTRQLHLIGNVEVKPGAVSTEWVAHSVIISVRCRNEDEENWISARRRDLIRCIDGQLRLARRDVFLQQTVLRAKNLSTFL